MNSELTLYTVNKQTVRNKNNSLSFLLTRYACFMPLVATMESLEPLQDGRQHKRRQHDSSKTEKGVKGSCRFFVARLETYLELYRSDRIIFEHPIMLSAGPGNGQT